MARQPTWLKPWPVRRFKEARDLAFFVGADDGNRTRTVSLGTGLSCPSDLANQDQSTQTSTPERPSDTASAHAVGHAAGTRLPVRRVVTACLQSTFTLSVIVAGLGMNPSPVRLNRPSSGLVVVRRGGQAIAFILAFRPLTTASVSAGRAIQKFVAETSINVLTELFSIGSQFSIPQYPQHQKP